MSFSKRGTLSQRIRAAWQHNGLLACLLWPLSLLTRAFVWTNIVLYRLNVRKTLQLHIPLIVVGNVVAGGAGKTPVVIELAKYLSATGRRVGVVSKGYGRVVLPGSAPVIEVNQETPSHVCGDEPKLIHHKSRVPVFVGNHRAQCARALLGAYPSTDIIISDDGLQHHALGRSIDVIVFDNTGVGNGWLLPAGPLREPWPRFARPSLSTAPKEFVISTNQEKAPKGFLVKRTLANYAVNLHGERLDLLALQLNSAEQAPFTVDPNQWVSSIHAVAGIARPELFFQMLEDLGLHLTQTTYLEDHAQLSASQFNELFTQAANYKKNQSILLCTEKDAIKLWEFDPLVWAVPLICEIEPRCLDAIDATLTQLSRKTNDSKIA